MTTIKRVAAAVEVLLIAPATLFMVALFVRNLQPQQYEPARTAQRIVEWYAARPHIGLWFLLILLPLAVLVSGSGTLLRWWRDDPGLRLAAGQVLVAVRAHRMTLLLTAATATAAAILSIVAVHLLTD